MAVGAVAFLGACSADRGAGAVTDADTDTVTPADTAEEADTAAVVDTSGGEEVDTAALADDTDGGEVGADAVDPDGPYTRCETVTSIDWLDVSEASGAAVLADGRLVLVGDSGNAGAGLVVDLALGTSTPITFPLGDLAGDDLEGLALAPDGALVGVTSAGFLREWRLDPATLALTVARDAYPVAASDDPAFVCAPTGVNCAKNYEGLCLHPAPADGACAGFLASKTDGLLYCLRATEAGYRVDTAVAIDVAGALSSGDPEAGVLSGCDFAPAPPYRLVAAGNVYASSALWEVTGYDAPATAVVTRLPVDGVANQEAVAFLADGRLASFGDLQGFDPRSPWMSFTCAP